MKEKKESLVFVSHTFPTHKDDFEANFVENLANTYMEKGYDVHVSTPKPHELNRTENKVNIHYFSYTFLLVCGHE